MLCTQKLEKTWSCAEDLVNRLHDILLTPLSLLSGSSGGSPSLQLKNTGGRGSPVGIGGYPIEDQLTTAELSSLRENLNGGDSKALHFIFAAYATSSARGGSPRISSCLGETWSGNHGVSFEGVSKFAQDFDLFPNIIVHHQLFQIFNVVANPMGSSSSSEYDGFRHKSVTLAGGEPLLTFRQFQELIVLIGLRSTYFKEAVEALNNLDRMLAAASPQRGTLMQTISPSSIKGHTISPSSIKGGNVSFLLAIERINRLIKWLNSSRGKERLGARARSITSPGLTLRTMSTRITTTLDVIN